MIWLFVSLYVVSVLVAGVFFALTGMTDRKSVAMGIIWPLALSYVVITGAVIGIIAISEFLVGGFLEIYEDLKPTKE